jgi:hypothetical protein
MKRGKIPKRFVFIFLKICKIFKKIKTNHPFPVAACATKYSAEKWNFTPFHVYLGEYRLTNFECRSGACRPTLLHSKLVNRYYFNANQQPPQPVPPFLPPPQ